MVAELNEKIKTDTEEADILMKTTREELFETAFNLKTTSAELEEAKAKQEG